MEPASGIELVVQAVSAIAAIVGLFFAGFQLKNVADATRSSAEASRTSSLMAVLQLESAISSARARWVDLAERAGNLSLRMGTSNPPLPAELELAQATLGEAQEQYLNTMDRLCACIVRGLVNEEVYRRDYRRWVDETIDRFPEYFRAAKPLPAWGCGPLRSSSPRGCSSSSRLRVDILDDLDNQNGIESRPGRGNRAGVQVRLAIPGWTWSRSLRGGEGGAMGIRGGDGAGE